jgi:outer membrane protein assembly factor BamB
VIANGVVFALASGEYARQVDDDGRLLTSQDRIEKKKNAVLYALDAKTGKVLWSSGNMISSWAHFSGLAVANGRVYVVTHDSTVYAFGLDESALL